jgi:ribosomal protein S27AE
MASIYVHLAGRDVDKALLKAYGVVMEEEREEKVELTRICPRCGEVAAASAKFCLRCSLALDVEAIIQVEEARKVGDQIMEELIQDPEVLNLLTRKLAEKGLGEKLLKTVKGVDKA